MPDAAPVRVGSYVRIGGLKSAPRHNGAYGFVRSQKGDRWAVVVAHNDDQLLVKPANLEVVAQDRGARSHLAVLFYPNTDSTAPTRATDVLVAAGEQSPLAGWPTTDDWGDELRFLREKMGWKSPETMSGVEREGLAKPDLVIYFDGGSTSSYKNDHVHAIARHLPDFELQKVTFPNDGVHGACVLVYSPTMSMTEHDAPQQAASGGALSLDDAAAALFFHHGVAAARQYKDHDNPMHRIFGGTM